MDLPVNKRPFDMLYSHMKYSDKAFMGSVTHPERAKDTVERAKILFGNDYIDAATGRPNTVIDQACIVTPFILVGAPTFGTPEPALVL